MRVLGAWYFLFGTHHERRQGTCMQTKNVRLWPADFSWMYCALKWQAKRRHIPLWLRTHEVVNVRWT